MSVGSFIGKILGKPGNQLINYRILPTIKNSLVVADNTANEIIEVLPYLRKNDLILAPKKIHYFTKIFKDLKIKYFKEPKEISTILKDVDPDNRIFINLNPDIKSLPLLNQFDFRVGRSPHHQYPQYNLLIKGKKSDILFKLMKRRSRQRIPIKIDVADRKKTRSFYRKLKKHGYKKIVYLKTTREKLTFNDQYFYIVETTRSLKRANVKTVSPESFESILYSYYADLYRGTQGPQKFVRKLKR